MGQASFNEDRVKIDSFHLEEGDDDLMLLRTRVRVIVEMNSKASALVTKSTIDEYVPSYFYFHIPFSMSVPFTKTFLLHE